MLLNLSFLMLSSDLMYYAAQVTFSLVVCVCVHRRDTSYSVCCWKLVVVLHLLLHLQDQIAFMLIR